MTRKTKQCPSLSRPFSNYAYSDMTIRFEASSIPLKNFVVLQCVRYDRKKYIIEIGGINK